MKFLAVALSLWLAQDGMSWGQRGHELVTIVAARLMAEDSRLPPELRDLMIHKEHLLAHLANVPDIVWRNGDKATVADNAPTHFFDVDHIFPTGMVKDLKMYPSSRQGILQMIEGNCKLQKTHCVPGTDKQEKLSRVGHAPQRIQQLMTALSHKFETLSALQKKAVDQGQKKAYDEALTLMGLVSHFVGDLSNPLHTSANYNGQQTGQDGIHAYFETDVVAVLDLNLGAKVLDAARKNPAQKIFSRYHAKSYFEKALALCLDSHSKLDTLLDLDRRHSLLEAAKPLQVPRRRQPRQTMAAYEGFIVQQLGIAANVLQDLWLQSWLLHKPKLSHLRSYTYPTAPAFVPVDY